MRRQDPVFEGSGNIFADLDLPDAHALLVKAELVGRLDRAILARGLPHIQAARLMGLTRPALSRLLRTEFHAYSVNQLQGFVQALDPGSGRRSRPDAAA